ncbi:hypothetical protein CU029_2376 [Enterococcus faecium]|nr:hypothetical protein [Enterococcus faecium]
MKCAIKTIVLILKFYPSMKKFTFLKLANAINSFFDISCKFYTFYEAFIWL